MSGTTALGARAIARCAAIVAFSLCIVAPARAQTQPEATSRQLQKVFSDFSAATRPLFPLAATANGWHAYDDQFANDISESHRQQQRELCRSFQDVLARFDRSALGETDRLSYDIFDYNLRQCVARLALDLHLLPVDQVGFGLPATFPIFASGKGAHPFRNASDYDNLLKRIPGFVDWMDTAIANMRRGVDRGWTQPRPVVERILPQLEPLIVTDARKSLFYQPIENMPEAIGEEERTRLKAAYERMIMTQVVPAYARFRDFLRDEYLARSRTSAGVTAMPDGARLYAFFIHATTTLSLSADEIYALGERETKRVRARIEALKVQSGFSGDVRAWAQEMRARATRYKTRDDAIAAYRALHDKVSSALPQLFTQRPKADYEIRAVEPYRELGASSQYWTGNGKRPGIFYVNLRALSREPAPVSVSLFLHEALPGHHFQFALARENRALPSFRRAAAYPAFTEGWAMYAESLGVEMGLYASPYDELSFLHSQLWSSLLLMADVGLNARGWTREQTIRFLDEQSLTRDLNSDFERSFVNMVERMMARPGNVLPYRIGQLTFADLRAQAERALGPRFDVRAFHDELLKDGAMPLGILKEKVARWIAREVQ